MSDIIPAISGGPFEATPFGLLISDRKIPYAKWEEYGRSLRKVQAALRWCIGDWLNYGEEVFGEMYTQAIDIWPEYSYSDLSKMKTIAYAYPISSRRMNISWSLHAEVAKVNPGSRNKWFKELENGMTRAELRHALKNNKLPGQHIERVHCPVCGTLVVKEDMRLDLLDASRDVR